MKFICNGLACKIDSLIQKKLSHKSLLTAGRWKNHPQSTEIILFLAGYAVCRADDMVAA
jgi:hypothetical protein